MGGEVHCRPVAGLLHHILQSLHNAHAQLKNVKFVNYEDFYHMGSTVMNTWALGWRFAWNQVGLQILN